MEKYVVDTSVIAKLFLENEENRDKAIDVFDKAENGEIQLFAPALTWYELNNVLIKDQFSEEEIKRHLSVFQTQVRLKIIKIVPHSQRLLNKVGEIVRVCFRNNRRPSTYDATFHALAILRNAVFLTADRRYYNKTREQIGSIMMLQDFNV